MMVMAETVVSVKVLEVTRGLVVVLESVKVRVEGGVVSVPVVVDVDVSVVVTVVTVVVVVIVVDVDVVVVIVVSVEVSSTSHNAPANPV